MAKKQHEDIDEIETQEWLDALSSVLKNEGVERADFILKKLIDHALAQGCSSGLTINTPYKNTIAPQDEVRIPGDLGMEQRIRALIRWNAMAMVVRAAHTGKDLGGHIGTFASSATLYDVGFNHFWRAPTEGHEGDLIYVQGHASPGIYARSFLEGRLSEADLENFRQEITAPGLSSYPHPWLMPNYWQFATVSMGLGPLQAIFHARFMKYLQSRGIIENNDRKIWCFCGDGEMDEPESLGSITVAGREELDNLVFVVNCNLQRLDGPVRGNGKIVQELEAIFRGAGWNVIKVLWGGSWDPLFEADKDGLMQKRMEEAVDGDYQNYKAHSGAYTREHFFGKYPDLKKMVEHLSDADIWRLKRGGHDSQKVFAAYHQAVNHRGQPTVILAKTVKGYGLGDAGEAKNIAHNVKKMADEQVIAFRNRFNIPIPDDKVKDIPFYRPDEDSPEIRYLKERRGQLGGGLPYRREEASESLTAPSLDAFASQLQSTGEREISTTMAFVRILSALCRDKQLGKRVVPIVPDEARTFGMEGLFRQMGIYSPKGQLYQPVDSDQVMFYKEAADGQIFQEGLNEAGSMCTWLAAATSYSHHNKVMIPFYIFYSMFGFQRIGDLAYAAGDMRARGFLIGGTSGRTTLNGEGLQHEDGHSHVLASTIPNCRSYDPTFSYELAVIIQHGLKRMLEDKAFEYYYITVMNENYHHPEMPKDVEEGIIKGLYLLNAAKGKKEHTVELLGSGTILHEVLAAQKILEEEHQVAANVWSAPSFNELAREGRDCERWNRLHPDKKPRLPYVTAALSKHSGPVIAATDYMKQYADQIRQFIPNDYTVLGTDGFGRSDSREMLRVFFEVDRYSIVYAALHALVQAGKLKKETLEKAIKKYGIDTEKPNPTKV